jgi:hypothetical protein
MYKYIIKKEKWYNDKYLIFLNDIIIGQFSPSGFKSSESFTFDDAKFVIKPKNIWATESFIMKEEVTIGLIKNFSFKNYSRISIFGKNEFFLRSSFFNSKQEILKDDKSIGTVKNKFSYIEINSETELDKEILSSLISITQYENTAILVVFIVIFITVLS